MIPGCKCDTCRRGALQAQIDRDLELYGNAFTHSKRNPDGTVTEERLHPMHVLITEDRG